MEIHPTFSIRTTGWQARCKREQTTQQSRNSNEPILVIYATRDGHVERVAESMAGSCGKCIAHTAGASTDTSNVRVHILGKLGWLGRK